MNRNFFLSLMLIIVSIFFTGCAGVVSPVYEKDMLSVQDDKYNIQVQVIPQEELKRQSGSVPSPFIREAKVFEPREYVAVSITIKNKTEKPVTFKLKDLELHFGANFYYTKNSFQLKNYWRDDDDIASADKTRMETIIDRYLLPRDVSIAAGGLKRGYAVFFAKMPKYGEMILYLPLMGEGFKPDVYEFKFPFTKI